MANNGITAEQVAELAEPYYKSYLMGEGRTIIPQQSPLLLITGNNNKNNVKI